MITAELREPRHRMSPAQQNSPAQEAALAVLYPPMPEPSSPGTLQSAYQLAQKLISNLRKSTIDNDVLTLMSREDETFFSEYQQMARARQAEEKTLQQSMHAIVDRSFGCIEPYIDELNSNAVAGEVTLAFTPPQRVTEQFGSNGERKSFYRARVSTSKLSIVIRGGINIVEFFVLPAPLVMGFSTVEDRYEPLMKFTATGPIDAIEWEVEGKSLTTERLERYCLLLLNYLLEETRAELKADQTH